MDATPPMNLAAHECDGTTSAPVKYGKRNYRRWYHQQLEAFCLLPLQSAAASPKGAWRRVGSRVQAAILQVVSWWGVVQQISIIKLNKEPKRETFHHHQMVVEHAQAGTSILAWFHCCSQEPLNFPGLPQLPPLQGKGKRKLWRRCDITLGRGWTTEIGHTSANSWLCWVLTDQGQANIHHESNRRDYSAGTEITSPKELRVMKL